MRIRALENRRANYYTLHFIIIIMIGLNANTASLRVVSLDVREATFSGNARRTKTRVRDPGGRKRGRLGQAGVPSGRSRAGDDVKERETCS